MAETMSKYRAKAGHNVMTQSGVIILSGAVAELPDDVASVYVKLNWLEKVAPDARSERNDNQYQPSGAGRDTGEQPTSLVQTEEYHAAPDEPEYYTQNAGEGEPAPQSQAAVDKEVKDEIVAKDKPKRGRKKKSDNSAEETADSNEETGADALTGL